MTCFYKYILQCLLPIFKSLKSEMAVNKVRVGNYCNHNMLKTKCSIFTVLNTSEPRDFFLQDRW